MITDVFQWKNVNKAMIIIIVTMTQVFTIFIFQKNFVVRMAIINNKIKP